MKQYTLPYVKSTASGNLLYDSGSSDPVLSNNPEGCDGVVGERFRGRGHVYNLWLIRVDVWQKPTQYCKATILQLKINKLTLKK